ncbi:Uu.00g130550.m01.CDS01 [Anthostomella pinea]|uniref:Uu.00g130550.m01.CDS01 n=1 Tax=Anthostomella pinea TaxID=933095 RepID=A0AAI8VJB0_9PEZI|nr:Uu.00g130550.m01.CDS01 [Anthostomella pinea]
MRTNNSDHVPSYADDPVCIVGMACRLPGGINAPSRLWDFLLNKQSAQGPVPAQRFNIGAYYSPDGSRPGLSHAAGGYFIQEDVRQLDNHFFGINNIEASSMDPQQRKLLEVVFECLEDAGIPMERISGTNTGVFVGNFTVDHQTMQTRDPDMIHRYTASGCGTTILANRISHVFNLQGPSFTLDTACSSSIYCLHSGISAIKVGDCDEAIIAGANLILSPEQCIGTMKAGVLSPTSTCHTFDISADGYGRAEGVSAVYLKRLSAALEKGDKIWAIVRGTAVNANGSTPGITQPSVDLQEAVIRKAYSNAGLDFADTDYIECHGTGTPVGDPIEVEAIGRCFSRQGGTPLMIGGVKPNLGHSEAASGLTSLIKVALALNHDQIPPTYGVKELNPKLRLNELNLKVVTEAYGWPRALRRVSLNSFGYGGANAHAILESPRSYLRLPPASAGLSTAASDHQYYALPISAASQESLKARERQVRQVLESGDAGTVQSLAWTLAEGRSHMAKRQVLLARATCHEIEVLELGLASDVKATSVAFGYVFTGQGAQYPGMAKELLEGNTVFLASIRGLDKVLQALPAEHAPGWTLEQSIIDAPEISQIQLVTRSQPVCTAVQVALVDLLRSWGVNPTGVVGHSSGEIAAAYAARLLNAKQAILVAYFRGYAVAQLKTRGAMLAASLGVDSARALIENMQLGEEVAVACVNAPESVTLSGSLEAIEQITAAIQKLGKGTFVRQLKTDGRAYHSRWMREVGDSYEQLLAPYMGAQLPHGGGAQAEIEMHSSVGVPEDQASVVDSCRAASATYWRANLEMPVQFQSALTRLIESRSAIHLIEIGPHPALKGPIRQITTHMKRDARSLPYSFALSRDRDADKSMKELAADVFLHGHELSWLNVNPKQPAGNGIDWMWRNTLRLREAHWVRDHRLESQVVFPAAGYLSMAMEALSQIVQFAEAPSTFIELRNVNFGAALVVHDGDDEGGDAANAVELHTTMSARKLSTATNSMEWYDFAISSWKAGQANLHCAGGIRLVPADESVEVDRVVTVEDSGNLEDVPHMSRWYGRFEQEGLCFGRHFQSITGLKTHPNRLRCEAICSTRLTSLVSEDGKSAGYPMHPTTIDACLQAGIMSSAAGDANALHAYLPIFINQCRVRTLGLDLSSRNPPTLHARSTKTGMTMRRIDCTMWGEDALPLIDFQEVRMSQYTGKTPETPSASRQPCLRVQWKPDIHRLDSSTEGDLSAYMAAFTDRSQSMGVPDERYLAVMGVLVDLVAHKNPQIRVAELGEERGCNADQSSSLIDQGVSIAQHGSWSKGRLDESNAVVIDDNGEGPFDLLIIPGPRISQDYWQRTPRKLREMVKHSGVIITHKTEAAVSALNQACFAVKLVEEQILLAINTTGQIPQPLKDRHVIILVREPSHAVAALVVTLASYLKRNAGTRAAQIIPFRDIGQIQLCKEMLCISFLEAEKEFLASMDQGNMDLLRTVTNVVTDLLWVTGADMLGNSPDPDLTLSSGLSRAIMLEQPSLRFSIMDVRSTSIAESNMTTICENMMKILDSFYPMDDKEFVQKESLLYVSRFAPDFSSNLLFQRRLGAPGAVQNERLGTSRPAEMYMAAKGVSETIQFRQKHEPTTSPPDGCIDVLVKAISLNAKDVYALHGRIETHMATNAVEISGVVTALGPGVVDLRIGDRVLVMAPTYLGTTARVPAWATHRMLPEEKYTTMPTLPVVYTTALYALRERAHLRAKESVLIHSGAGAFGIAAITTAQRMGATVYTTAGTEAKRSWISSNLGVPLTNIFHSRDTSFARGIKQATGGRGVDVVVNALVGDLLHATWACIAPFGRFVEIGKKELTEAGRLDMEVFVRSVTFTAFDLNGLFFNEDPYYRDLLRRLTTEVLDLYRSGVIKPVPITVFPANEIARSYRYFSSHDRIGKVVVSLEDDNASIPVTPSQYLTLFDPAKVYLLVGCLGGLGRSLSRWMLARGARTFVFLGRSGCDKPSAKDLVRRLETSGSDITVVKGNVTDIDSVTASIAACKATGKPIGGVVQAAMGLHEALFARMTSEAWHEAIQPKWAGSHNLHRALENRDESLDFFLLMSSVSGSVGTATESNYCAANGFLDAFAHWRRSLGKPAVSVGLGMISEVGYLHENPEIAALLLRKGIQPLSEAEFLQVVDLALAGDKVHSNSNNGSPAAAHILTGLETSEARRLIEQGFDVSYGSMQDPRAAVLRTALNVAPGPAEGAITSAKSRLSAAAWSNLVPVSAMEYFMPVTEEPSLELAVLRLFKKQFSSLILMPLDSVDAERPLIKFGMDSMISSELRTWIWTSFQVDVPFFDIMSPDKTLSALAKFVEEGLVNGSARSK